MKKRVKSAISEAMENAVRVDIPRTQLSAATVFARSGSRDLFVIASSRLFRCRSSE